MTVNIDPDAPAFPGVDWISQGDKRNPQGITVRATMALQLMAGMLGDSSRRGTFDQFANDAIKATDALIEALNVLENRDLLREEPFDSDEYNL